MLGLIAVLKPPRPAPAPVLSSCLPSKGFQGVLAASSKLSKNHKMSGRQDTASTLKCEIHLNALYFKICLIPEIIPCSIGHLCPFADWIISAWFFFDSSSGALSHGLLFQRTEETRVAFIFSALLPPWLSGVQSTTSPNRLLFKKKRG